MWVSLSVSVDSGGDACVDCLYRIQRSVNRSTAR